MSVIYSRLRSNDPLLTEVEVRPRGDENAINLDHFCSSVQENSNVSHLKIYNLDIDRVAAEALSAAIRKMSFLKTFEMFDCPWDGIEVAMILATSLASVELLLKMHLIRCEISDGGVQTITASLSTHNKSLQEFWIAVSPFGNEKAIAIGSLLAQSNSLEFVYLSGLEAGWVDAIANGIAQNTSLESLIISLDLPITPPDFADIENTFKKVIYNDDSIASVLSSNHTIENISPQGAHLHSLLAMNCEGQDEARRKKIIRFLNENPGSLLSGGMSDTLLPNAIEKIGRVGGLHAMFELVQDIPSMFEGKVSSKRSRS